MMPRPTHYNIPCCLMLIAVVMLAAACGGSGAPASRGQGDTLQMRHARNLTIVDLGDYTEVTVRNPWDTTRTLQRYALVDRDAPRPAVDGAVVIPVPLERSVVYTSVHANLIDELGCLDAIAGVCDADYIYNAGIRGMVADGSIADCGKSMAPNIEKILLLAPDAILLSAYENSAEHNKVSQTGIPVVDCAEYMETTPLAQAEWMRLYGRMLGVGERADSLFNAVEQRYNAIKDRAQHGITGRTVLSDMIYGQSWSIPGDNSTTAVLIRDAGGVNPFSEYKRSGGVQLAPEQVLYAAADADVWLLKYYGDSPMTLSQLAADNKIYTQFAPWRNGTVYGCNTKQTAYYDETPFHPDLALNEVAHILHPEWSDYLPARYYHRLEP